MDRLTTLLELLGLVLVTVGVGLWSVPAALVVGGLCCILVGILASRS